MGQTDYGHFGSHHRIRRDRDLFECLEKHLPHAGQHTHRHTLCQALTARPLVGADCRVFCGFGRDNHNADPMGQLCQITKYCNWVCPICVLGGKLAKRACRISAQYCFKEIKTASAIGKPQHGAHVIGAGFALTLTDCLVKQAHCVTDGAFCRTGDQCQSVFGN